MSFGDQDFLHLKVELNNWRISAKLTLPGSAKLFQIHWEYLVSFSGEIIFFYPLTNTRQYLLLQPCPSTV